MMKYILLAALSFTFISCAPKKDKLNPTNSPAIENPSDSPESGTPIDKSFELLKEDVAFYKGRYQMPDVFKKITDNKGNNFEDLYGTRNMREVLAGVYYRGGANNKYHRNNPRDNMNPLPADGLDNLCKEGFALALYYYDTNYKTAKPVNPCANRSSGESHTLNYEQLTAFAVKDFKPFLQKIHDRIKGKLKGPIYGHCWNGWHASGMMAAVTLKQFCGFTDSQAVDYWTKNTDGNSSGYDSVIRRVRDFRPVAGLTITQDEKDLICPQ